MTIVTDRIEAIELGATLYLPGTRDQLAEIALGRRYKQLRSAVICLEDSIRPDEAVRAMRNVASLLERLAETGPRPMLFVRPRDPAMLRALLRLDGIDRIQGFVIPKATAESLPRYLDSAFDDRHRLMPTLETKEIFDPQEVRRLRDQLLAVQSRILAVRIGGNDLLQTLGARRSALRTLYEGPLAGTVGALVTAFAPAGFSLSAPVFEHFASDALLGEEVERDVEHGLLTKTVIHPKQIAIVEAGYAAGREELAEARAILAPDSPAVFAIGGSMCEPATHRHWARTIVRRAELFGLKREPGTIAAVV